MKKLTISILVLLSVMMAATAGLANTSIEDRLNIKGEGPLWYVLPDEPAINPDAAIDHYIIEWEPVNGAYEYYIGVTQEVVTADDQQYFMMAEGFFHFGTVKNGEGKEYKVENVIFDSIVLDGAETQVDIAPILNAFEPVTDGKAVAYHVIVLVIPQSGEPVGQVITLPIA